MKVSLNNIEVKIIDMPLSNVESAGAGEQRG
jgi:hypothetical protein